MMAPDATARGRINRIAIFGIGKWPVEEWGAIVGERRIYPRIALMVIGGWVVEIL